MTTLSTAASTTVLNPAAFLEHWQGHRALTRRVIEAFPEDQLFTFTPAPPMRSFGAMACELVGMIPYVLDALASDEWRWRDAGAGPEAADQVSLLSAWDEMTARIEREGPGLPFRDMLGEKTGPWGVSTGSRIAMYVLDNEVHHRGQGYVYLRLLGLTPPNFEQR